MSPAKWTDEQSSAIDHRGSNVLLSAAAGAGKTAVLVERVVRRITGRQGAGPTSIDRLLVVTFTEAAAAEMKSRIREALTGLLAADPDQAWLRRQAALVNRASISTLHAFCLRLLRANFHRSGLDPAFRVLDEQEAGLLRQEVLEALFESRYEAGGTEFTGLVDRYGGVRGDEGLRNLVLKAYDFSRSVPFPEAWLRRAAASFDLPPGLRLGDHPWGRAALEEVSLAVDRAEGFVDVAKGLCTLPGGPAAYEAALEGDRLILCGLRRALETKVWAAAHAAFEAAPDFARLPAARDGAASPELKEAVKKARDTVKKILGDVHQAYFGRPEADLLAEIEAVRPSARSLSELVNEFARAYRQTKLARAQLDFADLEHYALDLLTDKDVEGADEGPLVGPGAGQADPSAEQPLHPTDLADELQARYDEVLVDEFQDINGVQEALLRLVSRQWGEGRPNLFMVGDVKQSIYRFRLADPGIFLRKYRQYGGVGDELEGARGPAEGGGAESGAPPDGRSLDLRANFRSGAGVVEAVNFIFRTILTKRIGEITYDDRAALVGKADYGAHPTPPGPVEVHLIERGPGTRDDGDEAAHRDEPGGGDEPGEDDQTEQADREDLEAAEKEAVVIAERIRAMVGGSEFSVLDRGSGTYRPVRFRDIVVILRATKERANKFQEVFNRYDLPVHAQLGTGYFEATEIEVVLALLRVIDNPRQDIPLLAVLRSPVGRFGEADLAAIRLAAREADFCGALQAAAAGKGADPAGSLADRCAAFLERLEDWRTWARREGLGDLVWRLYRDTGYLAYVGGLPGGPQRRANLLALHSRAGQFDRFAVQGLSRFLRFIDRLRETLGDLGTARAVGEDEDVVRIISAHGAKGLEFPVVILADLGHLFNLNDLKADWLFHRELGFGPYLVDPELRLAYPTIAWLAVRGCLSLETLAEEMRILYVAMTRARERLILVGSKRDLAAACRGWAMGGTEGGSLPDHQLAAARCWLDWLGSALLRHPDGRYLQDLAGRPTSAEPRPAGAGGSRWAVSLYGLPGRAVLQAAAPAREAGLPWDDLAELRPWSAAQPPDPGLRETIRRHLAWSYPERPATTVAAKVSVSAFLRAGADRDRVPAGTDEASLGLDEEALPISPAGRAPGDWRRPAFADEGAGLGGAERGSATHLVLQNLDLTRPLDPEDLAGQVTRMVGDLLLTEEQAAVVDLPSLARFWQSDLGRAVRAAGPRAKREVPFTLAVPLGEVYPGHPAAQESVLVQGIIDCLLEEDEGETIIDFKTDRLPAEAVPTAAEAYRPQLALYGKAVATILGRPVTRTALVFLHSGRVVEVSPE
ncbi:MAG TPA: helicase-exonuclease AddAB subunit AddA [Bacillota bacterium]